MQSKKKISCIALLAGLFLFATHYSYAGDRNRRRIESCTPDEEMVGECSSSKGRSSKPKTTPDPETGLMVIEFESDNEWNWDPNPKVPFSEIVKLNSSFDESSKYAVFDKHWMKSYPNEFGVVTRWSPYSVAGVGYTKTGCGMLACPMGVIVSEGDLPSPLEIKFSGKNYTLHGNDGIFVLPSGLIDSIKNNPNAKLSLRFSGRRRNNVIPIGPNTTSKLSELYSKVIKKWEIPQVNIARARLTGETKIKTIVGNSLQGVVTLKVGNGQGTGFFINNNGLILTNRHVVISGSSKEVLVETSIGEQFKGEVLYISRADDFALVQAKGSRNFPKSLPICFANYPTSGEDVLLLGSPLGLTNTVTRGIISAVRRSGSANLQNATKGATLIQTDAAMNPGNSGGPMLNEYGEVIGVNTFGRTASEGLNFGVSIIDILQQMNVQRPPVIDGDENKCGNVIAS
jgi:S1-C subfamily serine protease